MKYPDTLFIITSWDDSLFFSLKQTLMSFGADQSQMYRLQDRKSRPPAMNHALREASRRTCKYIVFLDEDVWLQDSDIFDRLKLILNNTGVAGAIANPKLVQEGQDWRSIQRDKPKNTPLEECLVDCTSNLISLNCAMFKMDLLDGLFFDEDLYGNQQLDLDWGWMLAKGGHKILVDQSTLVCTRANNYFGKSLAYHSVVARNLHILKCKWSDIASWKGVWGYNLSHNNEIPSIEELTHWSELRAMQYCYQYNRDGIDRCYIRPRLGGIIQAAIHIQSIEQAVGNLPDLMQFSVPAPGALPIFK